MFGRVMPGNDSWSRSDSRWLTANLATDHQWDWKRCRRNNHQFRNEPRRLLVLCGYFYTSGAVLDAVLGPSFALVRFSAQPVGGGRGPDSAEIIRSGGIKIFPIGRPVLETLGYAAKR